jgi:hypothetical protein
MNYVLAYIGFSVLSLVLTCGDAVGAESHFAGNGANVGAASPATPAPQYLTVQKFIKAKLNEQQTDLVAAVRPWLKLNYDKLKPPGALQPIDWDTAAFTVVSYGKPNFAYANPTSSALGLVSIPTPEGQVTPLWNCLPARKDQSVAARSDCNENRAGENDCMASQGIHQ